MKSTKFAFANFDVGVGVLDDPCYEELSKKGEMNYAKRYNPCDCTHTHTHYVD